MKNFARLNGVLRPARCGFDQRGFLLKDLLGLFVAVLCAPLLVLWIGISIGVGLGIGQREASGFTPLAVAGLHTWHPPELVDQTLNRQGPFWSSQPSQTHVRGLNFNGVDNFIELGNTPLYDDTAVAETVTVLMFINSSTGIAVLYSEADDTVNTTRFYFLAHSNAGELRVAIQDDAALNTIAFTTGTIVGAVTDNAWNVVTVVLDAAGVGWGCIVNGTAVQALGTAYDNAPATTTFNRAGIGVAVRLSFNDHVDGPIAYTTRHAAALTLAQVRQVQQRIADAVAADITLTIAGSETANANSPQDEWAFDEDADGKELVNIGSASTVGVRFPGDTTNNADDRGPNDDDLAQSTEVDQPKFLADGIATGLPAISGDGADKFIQGPFTTGGAITQPFSVTIGYKVDTWDAGEHLFSDDNSTDVRVFESGGNIVVDAGGTPRVIDTVANMQGTHVLHLIFDGADSKAYLDGGASKIAASPGTNGMSGLTLMANNVGGAGTHLDVQVADSIVANALPSSIDSDNLGEFAAGRVGTTWTEIS